MVADFVPLALRDLIRLARDAPARRPGISYPVSAACVTVDQQREELFGVQSIQDADHQSRIVEVATATDQNSQAGPLRNQRMLDEGKPDLVVAFPGGGGTKDLVRRAVKAGVSVHEVNRADDW
jgi:hypothetical protein